MSVTFNVEYTRPTTSMHNEANAQSNESSILKPAKLSSNKIKTADLSHITDHRAVSTLPSFIPPEFSREITTPIPLRPSTSVPDPETNQWKTPVFPSIEATNSRQEVENLGEWLNQVLEKNQKDTKDPLDLATNARHWFTIAFDELCRQVAVECPERSKLLSSIWKRYQSLFGRVVQLHQEEKKYLVTCHKDRTSALKQELDSCQARLKQVSQQYRDDQERWSNSREREETKFANMRKKLDLQVKNKRSLLMQIKSLKEKLGQPSPEIIEEKTDEVKQEAPQEVTIQIVSDRVHALRHKLKTESNQSAEVFSILEEISHFVDHNKLPSRSTKEMFPSIMKGISPNYQCRIRSLKWLMSAMTYFYANRLAELSQKQQSLPFAPNRNYFANLIFEQLITVFGSPIEAAETFYDMIETAINLYESGNIRCKTFLQFCDIIPPFKDSVYLDFYCYCVGSFFVSNTTSKNLFNDSFEDNKIDFSPLSVSLATELAQKVLFSITESDIATIYINEMKDKFALNDLDSSSTLSQDMIIDFLMDVFEKEEIRAKDQIREQYEMDAAQYGGIVTLGQFQTLTMFSSKKLEQRMYVEMMRDAMMKSSSKTLGFSALIEAMHEYSMLVPFSFDRIDYSTEDNLEDIFGFMKEEYIFHQPDIMAKLEKYHKTDESLFKQLNAAKSKFEQVVETKRAGFFTEVAQRELYEKLRFDTKE